MKKQFKKLFYLSILGLLIFSSCKKQKLINHYDEINHYSIDNESANKFDDVKRFNEIFTNVYSHKLNFYTFEKELISFGYKKNKLNIEKVREVDEFLSNNIYYESHLTACIPSYRDIVVLKKRNKIVGIIKICFECSMIDKYGEIKTSLVENDIDESYFSNFDSLYKILHNKDFKNTIYSNPKNKNIQ